MIQWKVTAAGPDADQLRQVAGVLSQSGVVLAPTDTIYGLHAIANDETAIDKIYQLKARPIEKSLPVLFASLSQLKATGALFSEEVEAGLQEIWPAPLTAIVRLATPIVATAGSLTVAARVPAIDWLRVLIESTGPLASTSANRAGQPPIVEPSQLPKGLSTQLDGVLDAGPIRGAASTIVDFTVSPPRVVREGKFLFRQNLWKTSRKSL